MQTEYRHERKAILSRAAAIEARRQSTADRLEAAALQSELDRLGRRFRQLEVDSESGKTQVVSS